MKLEGDSSNFTKRMIPSSNVGFREDVFIDGKKFYLTVDFNLSDAEVHKRD